MPPTDGEVPFSVAAAASKVNPRNHPVMFKIFQNVQYNVVQHKKYVKEMTKLYKKLDEESFRESFKNALHYLFTFGDSSANVDRVIQFVATFCTSLDDEEEFLLFIFEIIFDCQCVSGQSVRYRASQLLAAVLAALGDDASLEDDLCDKLLASQMQRLQDTRGAVRCRAALALQRLQNPSEQDDGVTRAYRFHMSCDPSSSVRRAIVMSIAKCTRNVPFVLERLRDVDEAVRRAAFLYISAINVTQLRVRQRVLTLKVGLTERVARVRRVVEEILLPGWLATFQGNIITLLKAIRLDNVNDAKDSQYVAGKLLESLFKRLPISELLEWLPTDKTLRLIPADKLNKETAWYWRHLAQHLQSIDDDETLEAILPDLVVLTGYIRAIVESPCPPVSEDPVAVSTRQYVLQELGCMLSVYDASDPTSRAALHQLIIDVLTGDHGPLSPEVIRAFVSALELVVPDISSRLELVSSLISSLREPEPDTPSLPPPVEDTTEMKIQRARLRVSLNVAMEAQEEAVREQNYALAAECKAKVEDLHKQLEDLNVQKPAPPPAPMSTITENETDAATLNKCLIILNSALDTPQLKSITPMMLMIYKELEVEILQNPELTENGLETLALYGMLDKEFAKEYKSFFFANLIDESDEATVMVSLRCIVDLLCVHGAKVFEEDSDGDKSQSIRKNNTTTADNDDTLQDTALTMSQNHSSVIDLLLSILDSACSTYREIIVEGLCRFLYLGHLESPTILSRLILLWFNPSTEDEDMLRQIIGVFFQIFPMAVDSAQDQIQKATIPTLRALANAPSSSPLAEIDQEAVVRFIVSLTRVNHELSDSQGGLATVLCQQLARRPASPEAGLACRMLALLAPPRDTCLAASLARTLRDLCTKLTDKQSCRNLTRYLGALEASERASLNKMSQTGITEGTMREDSLAPLGRTTGSLPQPIARSTHIVINETVEEEAEIDETSPTQAVSMITEERSEPNSDPSTPKSNRTSSETDSGPKENNSKITKDATERHSDSSDVSPVKKAKITKGKKKKLSINRQNNDSDEAKQKKGKGKGTKGKGNSQDSNEKGNKKDVAEKDAEEDNEKGIKRSRSQRSLVDVDRAQKAKSEAAKKGQSTKKPSPQPSPPSNMDSNVTVRRSQIAQSGSGSEGSSQEKKGKGKKQTGKKPTKPAPVSKARTSTGSNRSSGDIYKAFDDSDDTMLHTIVYEQEFVQSVLNDSSELLEANQSTSKGKLTIPETPEASEESEPEPEPEPKPKGKKNGKKK